MYDLELCDQLVVAIAAAQPAKEKIYALTDIAGTLCLLPPRLIDPENKTINTLTAIEINHHLTINRWQRVIDSIKSHYKE